MAADVAGALATTSGEESCMTVSHVSAVESTENH